jgi:hypothetical protein
MNGKRRGSIKNLPKSTRTMSNNTLCNLSNGITAVCDGADWEYDEQKKYCNGAHAPHTKSNKCIHLCDNERCDSYIAQDIAIKKL